MTIIKLMSEIYGFEMPKIPVHFDKQFASNGLTQIFSLSNVYSLLSLSYLEYEELVKINNGYYPKYNYTITLEIHSEKNYQNYILEYAFNEKTNISVPIHEKKNSANNSLQNTSLFNTYKINSRVNNFCNMEGLILK